MNKLTKFNQIYNKFLFQWSQGKSLSDIITILNNTENNTSNLNIEEIKNVFNEIFPKFLIQKCQIKFPLQDTAIVPQQIINYFWEKYYQLILTQLSNIIIDNIKNSLLQVLINIFGDLKTYDENIFNESALKLVKLNII